MEDVVRSLLELCMLGAVNQVSVCDDCLPQHHCPIQEGKLEGQHQFNCYFACSDVLIKACAGGAQ